MFIVRQSQTRLIDALHDMFLAESPIRYLIIAYENGTFGLLRRSTVVWFLDAANSLIPDTATIDQIPCQIYPVQILVEASEDLATQLAENNEHRIVIIIENENPSKVVDLSGARRGLTSIDLNSIFQKLSLLSQESREAYVPKIQAPLNPCGHQSFWEYSIDARAFVCATCRRPIKNYVANL